MNVKFVYRCGGNVAQKATPERYERGQRMKKAAHAAGLTSKAIAHQLGVKDGTVRVWWRGRSEPTLETLRAYADLVKVPANYLLYLDESGNQPVTEESRADLIIWSFVDAVMRGQEPAGALEAKTGKELGAERQHRLNSQAEAMRAYLSERVDRPWKDLSAEEQQEVIARLIEDLEL